MHRLIPLLLLPLLSGCPGQRRPPPQALLGPRAAPAVEEPAVDAESVVDAVPPVDSLDGLRGALAALRAEAKALGESKDRAKWDALVERIDGVQTRAFDLQEKAAEDEVDAVYTLLEGLDALRDDVVRRQTR